MFEILSPGPLMTVQDLGRPGARPYGVATGGAMDSFALEAANRLVGNPANTAGLEITAGGAALRLLRPTMVALAGGDLDATLDARPLPLWTAIAAPAGALLQFSGRRAAWGARAYLALAGGIDVPVILGSRGTDLAGSFGGFYGRALRTSDRLTLGQATWQGQGGYWHADARPGYTAQPTLRLLPGPHGRCFAPATLAELVAQPFQVSATSNRMGYRLHGVRLAYAGPCSLPSLGVVPGSIQVPPDGTPILLMADAQTTGGYPVIGVLIGADLPLAAQLLPGDSLRFAMTTLEAAQAARQALAAFLACGQCIEEGEALAALAGAIT